ncbi:prolyl oligopeptidase family serine peptidase [Sphingomonas sp. C3-2]|uniref:prolyl oligopeptidase family serine peptidase n=1 Tax=Sphingomonas sp. C3-2 TaxID=3062169 RepID=UPI00294B3524|nr:prolyl oligopeptidase family serine peptidase [Sphingomonas sp. C3-2]WOK37530.1 prolyl oligopeptidase family serine peptidase [Sphingomonas sp. C3-2]
MKKQFLAALLPMALLVAPAVAQDPAPSATGSDDPYLWLEDIEGTRALAWVRAENEKTLRVLQSDPRYNQFRDQALAILQAQDRIPYVNFTANGLDNFWQDETHVRGIWRSTTLASYRTATPAWETILDFDALAAAEKRNWVYAGGDCLPPDERLCLLSLSDGGKDATALREFDVKDKAFVEGGFDLPEGKQNIVWVDADTLLVARPWDDASVTKAGYPFVVKELKRGQPLSSAREVYRGTVDDVGVSPMVLRDAAGRVHAVGVARGLSYFEYEYVLFGPKGPVQLPLPKKAALGGIVSGRLLLSLGEDWTAASGAHFKSGSLLSYDLEEWKRDPLGAQPSLVFEPSSRQAINSYRITKNRLFLTILDNVQGKALSYHHDGKAWHSTPIELPANAAIGFASASSDSDEVMFTVTNYLTPTSLWYYDAANGKIEVLKSSPERFDASQHVVEQFFAVSRDGVRIPYFLVRPKNARMDGSTPTLLYGYGGFQISQLPAYAGAMGRLWLEQGNAYVVANLRGGGEFGPSWHEAGQGANKQRTWDDFIAVAQDLIDRKMSSPSHLGVVGGSQGGLLVGAAMTQRPDLFNAAIVQVPLFDMLRFTKLGAGASYVGEYGDPENPTQRKWLEAYSPYHNLVADKRYPSPLILSSTKDDRVHPAHARKAAARLAALGQPYFYYENIDGGHSAASNLAETARRMALEYVYASVRLADQ